MSRLKTLKDIQWHYFSQGLLDRGYYAKKEDLKELGIKWIKTLMKEPIYGECIGFAVLGEEKFETQFKTPMCIKLLKHIFNITEEDLK